MAQDIVVKELLTDAMIRAGADLTRRLDELQWPVLASLWMYLSDGNRWRLVFASPRVTSDGSLKSYETIQSVLPTIPAAEGTLALSDISVTEPEDRLIAPLRVAMSTGPTLEGKRFTRTVINGCYLEDAYIYLMSPTGQAA